MASVFDRPAEYEKAEGERKLLRMLDEGTPALHRERYIWLPPHEAEEDHPPAGGGKSDYAIRAERSVVEPYYRRAVDREVSTILGRPIVLKEDVPAKIRGSGPDGRDGWWENIDLRGNDGNVFMRGVIKDAVGDGGYSCVLVDHSMVPEGATDADLERLGLRPYWRHFRARDVLLAVPEVVNGVERLAEVRLIDPGPGGEERVRVLRAAPIGEDGKPVGFVTWEWWERKKAANGTETVEEVVGHGTLSPHTEIPLHPLYFGFEGFFKATPPYQHLAYLNLKHTRQDSDISEDMRISCGAQFTISGATGDEKKQRMIGVRRAAVFEDPAARAGWMERTGTAARVYMDYQAALERKMESVSNEPFIRRTGRETATGRILDTTVATTEIQARALAVRDFIEQLLMSTAKYRQLPSGGSVEVKMPAAFYDSDPEKVRQMVDMHARLGVPRKVTIMRVIKESGWPLPDDFDPQAEVELAEMERPTPTMRTLPQRPTDARTEALKRADALMLGGVGGNGSEAS